MKGYQEFNIRGVSDELKARLVDDAEERGTNMNDIAVGIMAEFFKVPFEPTGRPGRVPGRDGAPIVLSLPVALHRKIRAAAYPPPLKMEHVALRVLNTHYGLRYVPVPPKRRRRRRHTAEPETTAA